MVKIVCVIEVADAKTLADARRILDAFREAAQPSMDYGLTIYHASEREADTALYRTERE